MAKRVSMRMIAEAAGVSAAAVSQILNNRSSFAAAETCERVRRIADELGYRPNFGYKLMHSMETRTVGIMVASSMHIQEEYMRDMILRLLGEFGAREYAAFCHVLPLDAAGAIGKISEFLSRGVEHFVFLGAPMGQDEIYAMLQKAHVNYVSNREAAPRHVVGDTRAGMRELARHIRSKVGENFKMLCGEALLAVSNNRVQALMDIYPEYGFDEVVSRFVVPIAIPDMASDYYDSLFTVGYQELKRLLARHPDIGAVAFSNDALAIGGASLMMEEPYRPFRERVMLTGFNGERTLLRHPLPVSSVSFDHDKEIPLLAEAALNNEPCKILVPPIVHIR